MNSDQLRVEELAKSFISNGNKYLLDDNPKVLLVAFSFKFKIDWDELFNIMKITDQDWANLINGLKPEPTDEEIDQAWPIILRIYRFFNLSEEQIKKALYECLWKEIEADQHYIDEDVSEDDPRATWLFERYCEHTEEVTSLTKDLLSRFMARMPK